MAGYGQDVVAETNLAARTVDRPAEKQKRARRKDNAENFVEKDVHVAVERLGVFAFEFFLLDGFFVGGGPCEEPIAEVPQAEGHEGDRQEISRIAIISSGAGDNIAAGRGGSGSVGGGRFGAHCFFRSGGKRDAAATRRAAATAAAMAGWPWPDALGICGVKSSAMRSACPAALVSRSCSSAMFIPLLFYYEYRPVPNRPRSGRHAG